MLKGKTIVLGVTGSIAAYKIASLASSLKKLNADIHVIMTKNTTNFINPITFETLTGNKCLIDTFDRNFEFNVEHVSLAKKADVFLVAPASANVIGKIANGICDDMLTTTIMACKCPKLISPAMNTNMFENPILQDNLTKLRSFGYEIIDPATGYLACGDTGAGKMPEPEFLLESILAKVAMTHDLEGKNILITAGPTREALDPVRFITNHSSGKMGYAIAKNAYLRGANVTLVSGPVAIKPFNGITLVSVESAKEMFEAVKARMEHIDIFILSAAVADYTPASYSDQKIKKSDSDMTIKLVKTTDILKYLGQNRKENQKLVGFSMETEKMLENSSKKLASKNCDMICANSLTKPGTGFGVDTNQITLITKNLIKELPFETKENLSNLILDEIKEL